MSIEASNKVWKYSQSKGAERLVMLCLANYTNAEGLAWPSIETIHRDTQVSQRQITRSVAQLEADGELQIVEKGDGRGRSTIYRITIKGDISSIKGDKVSPFSGNEIGEKGDISSIKGDTLSIKGDMVSPDPLEPLGNQNTLSVASDPFVEIEGYFTQLTGLMPTKTNWATDWEVPIRLWLNGKGDLHVVKGKIKRAWDIASKNRLRIFSPRSLNNTLVNLDNGAGQGFDLSVWGKIKDAVSQNKFDGLTRQEKKALQAVTVHAVRNCPEDDRQLRNRFFEALGEMA